MCVQLSKDPEALREQSRRTRDFALRLTAWHNDVWKPVIAAVNGVCAGGGLHFVADADIVIASVHATFLDPHVSIGQVSAYETIALTKKSPMEAVVRMALIGHARAHDRSRARTRSGSVRRSFRPSGSARRRRRSPRRSRRTRPRRWPRPSARCGARSRPVSPTRPGPARHSSCRCGAIRTRKKDRAHEAKRSPDRRRPTGREGATNEHRREAGCGVGDRLMNIRSSRR